MPMQSHHAANSSDENASSVPDAHSRRDRQSGAHGAGSAFGAYESHCRLQCEHQGHGLAAAAYFDLIQLLDEGSGLGPVHQ